MIVTVYYRGIAVLMDTFQAPVIQMHVTVKHISWLILVHQCQETFKPGMGEAGSIPYSVRRGMGDENVKPVVFLSCRLNFFMRFSISFSLYW